MAEATKRCSTCQQDRDLRDFNVRRKAPDGLQSRCRSCSAEWYKRNRAEHMANVSANNARRLAENRARLVAYLLEHPCGDCGETDLRVLDFDHRDPTRKQANVGSMLCSRISWQRILLEIEKCDVRCANCHRVRTAEMRGWNRHRAQLERQVVDQTVATDRLATALHRPATEEPPTRSTAPVRVRSGVWRLSILV